MKKSLLVLCVTIVLSAGLVTAEDKETSSKPLNARLAQRVFQLTDLVLENHIDPPTRQQMILRGLKSTFRAAGAKTPKGLSQSLSAISKEPELATLLKKWNSQFKGKEEKLASAFTQGLMASISGRPYLISSEQMRVNSTIAANQYVGTGIVLRMDKKYGPTMPKVFFNGPAWKAGAKDGDVIVNIDDDDARKMPLQTVLRRLRGAKGSLVTVVVRQPNSDKTRTLKITRNVAFIPTVEGFKQLSAGKWQFTTDGKKKIAYIRVNRIGSSTSFEIKRIAAKLQREKLSGVILDLRFGGGSLHDTILLANSLLHSGTIGHIQYTEKRTTHKAKPGALFHGVPMVVLVQRNSNGDRLFLTAALQDNGRAKVVGEPTQSDAFVRRPIPIPDAKFAIVMPTGILQRGNGKSLMGARFPENLLSRAGLRILGKKKSTGIIPDFRVPLTNRKLGALQRAYAFTTPGLKKPQPDPHVDKAIEVLKASS